MLFPKKPTPEKWWRILVADSCARPLIPTNRNFKGRRLAKTFAHPNTLVFRESMAKEILSLKERPEYDVVDYLWVIPPELVFLRRNFPRSVPDTEKLNVQVSAISQCIEASIPIIEWIRHFNAVHNIWNQNYFYRAASIYDKPHHKSNQYNTHLYARRKYGFIPQPNTKINEFNEQSFLLHPLLSDIILTSFPLRLRKPFTWKVKKLPPDPQNININRFEFLIGREFVS